MAVQIDTSSTGKTALPDEIPQDAAAHLDDLVAVRLYRLGELIGRLASETFEDKYGTRITDLRILSLLHGDEEITVAEISRRAQIDKAWISRLVREMESKGLVQRTVAAYDAKARLVSLTEAGRDLQRRILPLSIQRERVLLGNRDRKEVLALLAELEGNAMTLLKTGGMPDNR